MKKIKILVILLLVMLLVYQVLDNMRLHVERVELPRGLDKKLIVVSDLHGRTLGGRLLEKIKEEKPDYILLTGDVISRRSKEGQFPMEFLRELSAVAKTYYISGNHEMDNPEGLLFLKALQELPIINLNDKINADGDILFMGINNYHDEERFLEALEKVKEEGEKEGGLRVLLAHRPERFDAYKELKPDLVLSGHTHGGQIRLPFVGALVAPNQGFFPKYDKGLITEDGMNLIISGGIGNSVIPLRLFNTPEIIVIEI